MAVAQLVTVANRVSSSSHIANFAAYLVNENPHNNDNVTAEMRRSFSWAADVIPEFDPEIETPKEWGDSVAKALEEYVEIMRDGKAMPKELVTMFSVSVPGEEKLEDPAILIEMTQEVFKRARNGEEMVGICHIHEDTDHTHCQGMYANVNSDGTICNIHGFYHDIQDAMREVELEYGVKLNIDFGVDVVDTPVDERLLNVDNGSQWSERSGSFSPKHNIMDDIDDLRSALDKMPGSRFDNFLKLAEVSNTIICPTTHEGQISGITFSTQGCDKMFSGSQLKKGADYGGQKFFKSIGCNLSNPEHIKGLAALQETALKHTSTHEKASEYLGKGSDINSAGDLTTERTSDYASIVKQHKELTKDDKIIDAKQIFESKIQSTANAAPSALTSKSNDDDTTSGLVITGNETSLQYQQKTDKLYEDEEQTHKKAEAAAESANNSKAKSALEKSTRSLLEALIVFGTQDGKYRNFAVMQMSKNTPKLLEKTKNKPAFTTKSTDGKNFAFFTFNEPISVSHIRTFAKSIDATLKKATFKVMSLVSNVADFKMDYKNKFIKNYLGIKPSFLDRAASWNEKRIDANKAAAKIANKAAKAKTQKDFIAKTKADANTARRAAFVAYKATAEAKAIVAGIKEDDYSFSMMSNDERREVIHYALLDAFKNNEYKKSPEYLQQQNILKEKADMEKNAEAKHKASPEYKLEQKVAKQNNLYRELFSETPLSHRSYLADLANLAEKEGLSTGQFIVNKKLDLENELREKEGLIIARNGQNKLFIRTPEEQERRAALAKESSTDNDD